jgi:hypothetical protein
MAENFTRGVRQSQPSAERAALDRSGVHDRVVAVQLRFPFETVGIMSKKISIFILVLTSLVSTGCAALVVGAGAGAGAYSYANGELARTYQADFPRTMEVCTQILTDLSMPIKAQHSEGEQTVIETERKDGTPVTLKVKIIGLDLTEVSVRTGVVGYWNRDLSTQFQEFIAQRLQP